MTAVWIGLALFAFVAFGKEGFNSPVVLFFLIGFPLAMFLCRELLCLLSPQKEEKPNKNVLWYSGGTPENDKNEENNH